MMEKCKRLRDIIVGQIVTAILFIATCALTPNEGIFFFPVFLFGCLVSLSVGVCISFALLRENDKYLAKEVSQETKK
jgi:hypothetical protein